MLYFEQIYDFSYNLTNMFPAVIRRTIEYVEIEDALKFRLIGSEYTFGDFDYFSKMKLGATFVYRNFTSKFLTQQTSNFGKVLKFNSESLQLNQKRFLLKYLKKYGDFVQYIHTLNLKEILIRGVSSFGVVECGVQNCPHTTLHTHIHTLDLTFSRIKDVSALSEVHTLNLRHTKVCDVTSLSKVHDLNLSNTSVCDVSTLGNVYNLNLRSTSVVDVSALRGVRILDLSNTKVEDVSALGNVHTLNLSDTMVSDVSALGKVHTLDLSWTKVVDVTNLSEVYNLSLKNTKVVDVSALGKIKCAIKNCICEQHNPNHTAVHILNLSCTGVTDVSALHNVYDLDLSHTKIKDVTGFEKVYSLSLEHSLVTDISPLAKVRCNFTRCNYATYNLAHTHIHKLNLKSTGVEHVELLFNVYHLNLSYTPVTYVNTLGLAYCTTENCKYRKWRENHNAVHILNLNGTEISDITNIENIHTLSLYHTKVDSNIISKIHTRH
ncbi:MAG TPA: hypothetical protein VLE02_01485 [Nitrosarchaeum sp.]|nr:hypothetical protein [Nitrosarchaeum sp.]